MMGFRIRLLAIAYVALLFLAVLAGIVPDAWAKEMQDVHAGSGSSSGSVSSGGDGSVQIAVSAEYVSAAADGSSSGGGAVSSQAVTASVHPVCWYEQYKTGAEIAEWFNSGKAEEEAHTYGGWSDPMPIVEGMYPDYGSYAEDTEGYWYKPWCDWKYYNGDDPMEFQKLFGQFTSNGPVYVPAGQAAPEPVIDGATLARAAWDAITIPTATIGYNPTVGRSRATVVGMDTWVWATGDTPKEVRVTATAGPVTATVTATASRLTLQPKDGTAYCTGFGIPWSEDNDRLGTDCVIVFDRSSAHFKDSVTPVDVKVSYAITYTATDGAAGIMDTHTTSTTTTIPVAEIQAIIVRPTDEP
ncbi:hypothetical protein SAMN04487766_10569 [Actinomyces ruminicola]|uniref:Enoyl reductase n=2 Tax=Actinomyces ruminicola TaxID=332524 RepID=A0A1G9V268_9ACTO|nr:hypothetical protein SAMN04487766_10569 [Actinomyces ruminicola]